MHSQDSARSAKLFHQSKIYLDETIDNAGLLDEGVRRGRIASALSRRPGKLYNYVRLQFRTDPAKALLRWSAALRNTDDPDKHTEVLEKSLLTLKDDELPQDRKIAGEVSYREINQLIQTQFWLMNNIIVFANCWLKQEKQGKLAKG